MALDRKVLAERPEAGEKRLGAREPAKAPHAPLPFTGGLMAVLGTVVHPRAGFHEDMPDLRKARDGGLGCRVAAQLVGHDLAGHLRAGGQHALEEALGCPLVAALLYKDVDLGAMLITGAP